MSRGLRGSALLLLAGLMLVPAPAEAQDWVEFLDQTSTRLVIDAAVGVDDEEEKDFISGDVDKDGDPDLVIVRKVPFTNAGPRRNVLLMNEGGVLVDRTSTLAPDFLDLTDDRDVDLADVDGDTWLDILTGGTFGEQPRVLMNLGEIGGVWQGFDYQAARMPTLLSPTNNGPKFCGMGVGDVTGDNRPDVYFTDYQNDMEDKLLINDGTGFFTDETDARTAPIMVDSTFGTDAAIADMNGDTFNDIIKDNATGTAGNADGGLTPAVSILYNDGTGNFTFQDVINNDAPYMFEIADFTKDGRLDLFVVDDGQDSYLINTGNNAQGRAVFTTTAANPSPNTSFFGGNVKFADLDGDEVLDVLVADVDTDAPGCSRQLVLLRGQGTPPAVSYSDPLAGASRAWTPQGTFDVEPMDINGDGALDLFIGTCDGYLVFMGLTNDIFEDGFDDGTTDAWSAVVSP